MNNSVLIPFENSFAIASSQIMVGIVSFVPSLLGALVVFLIGLIVAGWLKSLTVKILDLTKLGNLFTNPAVKEFSKNAQISQKIEVIFGEIVRWLVIILFSMASVNILGLTSVSLFLSNIISGIPTLIAAIIILVVGIVVAGFLERMAKGALGSKDPSFSRLVGKVVSYGTLTLFVLAALSQLGIASFFIQVVFMGFIGSITLALGIGLGLGSQDLIKKLLEEWYKKIQS